MCISHLDAYMLYLYGDKMHHAAWQALIILGTVVIKIFYRAHLIIMLTWRHTMGCPIGAQEPREIQRSSTSPRSGLLSNHLAEKTCQLGLLLSEGRGSTQRFSWCMSIELELCNNILFYFWGFLVRFLVGASLWAFPAIYNPQIEAIYMNRRNKSLWYHEIKSMFHGRKESEENIPLVNKYASWSPFGAKGSPPLGSGDRRQLVTYFYYFMRFYKRCLILIQ